MYVFTEYESLSNRKNKSLEYMGSISYEFYIIHFTVLLILCRYITSNIPFLTLSLSLSIMLAHILHNQNTHLVKYISGLKSI